MNKVIIIRWCEIHLKGNNRGYFERLLFDNIKKALTGIELKLSKSQARYLIKDYLEEDEEEIMDKLKKVSGVHSISKAIIVPNDLEEISKTCINLTANKCGTFKVETKRADKTFALNSMEVSGEIGHRLLESNDKLKVDLFTPSFIVYIDIRESGETFIYSEVEYAVGGLPVGSSDKGLLLLSGGIDSPVAGQMMAKRGMKVGAIHFHSYPYTSEAAKEKVIDLAKILSNYTLGMDLYIVSFTEIQEEIHKRCPSEYMITIMRRFMMRIAERVAKYHNYKAIITGENLGQVASQTVQSITSTDNVIETLPVFRPLIGFDKLDIIKISKEMGAYETSILPYEDCCTVFLPDHPVIKPKLEKVIEVEEALDVESLVSSALEKIEKVTIEYGRI